MEESASRSARKMSQLLGGLAAEPRASRCPGGIAVHQQDAALHLARFAAVYRREVGWFLE